VLVHIVPSEGLAFTRRKEGMPGWTYAAESARRRGNLGRVEALRGGDTVVEDGWIIQVISHRIPFISLCHDHRRGYHF